MNDESALEGVAALSNKSRWEIFWLLVNEQCGQKSAGEIGERLSIAPATLSFHLKELTHAGLLRATRSGSRRLYAPDCDVLGEIADYMMNKCAGAKREISSRSETPDEKEKTRAEPHAPGHEWVR
jgi:DNA-binding transcriptional ArsR family regulator